jgi:membrane protease YdiL (CAAX protease family)
MKSYSVKSVNVLFLVLAMVFLTVGAWIQSVNLKLGILVTEYVILLVPLFFLGKLKKVNFKKTLRLNKLSIKNGLLIGLMAILFVPLVMTVNMIVMTFVFPFIEKLPENPITPDEVQNVYLSLFLFAVTPGICEELFFRGMVMNAYEKRFGFKWAGIISAILFGLFHYNIFNLAGPIVLGIFFAYLVQITDSIYASMIAHAVNNGVAIMFTSIAPKLQKWAENVQETTGAAPIDIGKNEMLAGLIASIFFLGFVAFIFLIPAYFILRKIKQNCIREKTIISVNKVDYFVVNEYNSSVTLIKNDIKVRDLSYDELL